MTKKTKHRLIGATVGITLGGIFVTLIGKAVMEAGIAVLTGAAVVGTGFIVGMLAFPKKLVTRS